jgi:nucleoside-diphosphate-sugar epimerase
MRDAPCVLVTGANGFVGSALCKRMERDAIAFRPAVRRKLRPDDHEVGLISAGTDWSAALKNCDAVVHLAARVHVMNEHAADPLAAFREVNVAATVNLARQAAQHGVRRFVFVSSIKVNGEMTRQTPFSAGDKPAPQDAYGQSKLEAELALQRIAQETGLEVVVVRPPLVYGPGVRANFLQLMYLIKRGIPLPLGGIDNCRSLVAIDNLVDLLLVCLRHPAAAKQTFLVSDGHDVSTPELVRMLAVAMGKRTLLMPVPPGILAAGAALLGKTAAAERLLGSLQVDIEPTRSLLDWQPPVSMEDAIDATVAHFLSHTDSAP